MNWKYHEFTDRPLSDSCWSVQTGPDGRISIACCTEHTGGETATVVRLDETTDSLEYLFDLDEVTGDLRDSGRATQCKIHYSFVPDREKGLIHAATHLSGPPKGETSYNPWASWNDPARAFRGAFLISYDTAANVVTESRLMIPKEGCRCLALDEQRRVLYAVTYPRDHFVSYDLASGRLTDHGRIGSINTQCIFLDPLGRAYLFDDSGRMLRFDPERQRLEELPHFFPRAVYQSAWHGVLYDAVADPRSGAVYMVPWKGHPHLARFWPMDGTEGRLEDLGPITQDRDPREVMSVNLDHVGALVWGADEKLHLVKAEWSCKPSKADSKDTTSSMLMRFDPAKSTWERLGPLFSDIGSDHYVSRGALSARGNMVFGKIMACPAGVYRVTLPDHPRSVRPWQYLRLWG
ncbi:MAG: hypothetical protein ACKOEZ_07210 [Spartobacteria bacterium]